jgi:glucokinase
MIDATQLEERTSIRKIRLVNDLMAHARGVELLGPADLVLLNAGIRVPASNAAIIAAGTGLGEAGLIWDGTGHRVLATEGGHVDFAPRDELQLQLWRFLHSQFGHVSYERVLSGPGLANIHRFLIERGEPRPTAEDRTIAAGANPAAAITTAAFAGRSELCNLAIEVFVSVYGAAAGNIALKLMATGGVYLGGGIAPKLLTKLQEPAFMRAFADKGRMGHLSREIPVAVILNTHTALYGSALFATELSATDRAYSRITSVAGDPA